MMRLFNRLRPARQRESGGMRVSESVHRRIVAGDGHRDEHRHALAAHEYAEAVRADPRLYHIWLQLGHALKDSGNRADARTAYDHALCLRAAGEPSLFLGQIERMEGRNVEAARHYLAAAVSEDAGTEATAEFLKIIGMPRPVEPTLASSLIRSRSGDRIGKMTSPKRISDAADRVRLMFDVTDLIAHFRRQRRPTGIQRVELEVSLAALEDPVNQVSICAFVAGRDELVEVDVPAFQRIALLATTGDEATEDVWERALFDLLANLFFVPAISVNARDIIVNLGTSWSIYDYFRIIRNLKARFDLVYVAFVHDLIPIVMPDYCRGDIVAEYVTWFLGARDHVDMYLVNSAATKRDLLRAASALNPERIRQIPFDVGFRPPGEALALEHLRKWNIAEGDFALFVATLEPRKNHLLAFNAWSELMSRYGTDMVPQLVCVGRTGWLNDEIFKRLQKDEALAAKVTIIDQVNDEELALLYRTCRFLLYPSHYEGWGLPISEALSFGKIPVVATNSSLIEAGGGFAVTFADDSLDALVAAVEQVAFDDAWRERHEEVIRRDYRPRRWSDVAAEIQSVVTAFARTPSESHAPPLLVAGRSYPVALNKVSSIADHVEGGERLRIGDGWLWPEENGCRVKAGGGTIAFEIAEAPHTIGVYVCLRGLESEACNFQLTCDGGLVAAGALAPEERRWVRGDVPMSGRRFVLTISGDRTEIVEMATYGDTRAHEASIAIVAVAWDDGCHSESLALLC